MPDKFNPASDDAEFEKAKTSAPPRLYKFLESKHIAEQGFIYLKVLIKDVTRCLLTSW